jgi:streptomycin 6-kinase
MTFITEIKMQNDIEQIQKSVNIMKKLSQNIANIFGNQGEKWISDLPFIIEALSHKWKLSNIVPVDNMTFNYVTKATKDDNQQVMLKISCDEKTIANETNALIYFNGNGSIKLIDNNEKYHALLLQQATPGITLKSIYPEKIEYVMDCYIATMKKLHNQHLPDKHNHHHISEWLKAIDQLIPNKPCPSHLLEKAIELKNSLLASMTTQVFLHGDLHHDNILKNGEEWLAIDPKGIIGEPEFEIAAFDFMYITELANNPDVRNIFNSRVNLLALKANLNTQRITDWVFVRLILMAAWQIEDNGDPKPAITLAEMLA